MKKGFSTVYIVLIMTALVMLILVIIEAASGYAAGSIGENVCLLSGESLLSEFEKDLYGKYGVLALRSDKYTFSEILRYYLTSCLNNYGSPVKLKLDSCDIDFSEYNGLNYEEFSKQIDALGTMIMARESLENTDIFKSMQSAQDKSSVNSDDYESKLDEIVPPKKDTGNTDESDREKQANKLRRILHDSKQEGEFKPISDFKISNSSVNRLPSDYYSCKKRTLLLISGGITEISSKSVTEGEYIIETLSNYTSLKPGGVLQLETEYVLYGNNSDKKNEKAVRSSLFALRTACNMADILTDKAKLAAIAAEASAFTLIPYPIAFGILLTAEAAMEAKENITVLLSGGNVPLFKDSNVIKGYYKDYLRLFLLLIPEEEKMIRLMDIMQMNLNHAGSRFTFCNYAYGFDMTVNLSKKTYLLNIKNGNRNGEFTQTHKYF